MRAVRRRKRNQTLHERKEIIKHHWEQIAAQAMLVHLDPDQAGIGRAITMLMLE